MLAATHILHMLEIPVRHKLHDAVPEVVKRGHRALDELARIAFRSFALAPSNAALPT